MSKLEKFLRGRLAAAIAAVIVGFVISAVVLAVAGYNPLQAFAQLLKGAFGKPKYIANVFINILLNTVWLSILYGKAFSVLVVPRITKNLIALPIEVIILFLLLTSIKKVLQKHPGLIQ